MSAIAYLGDGAYVTFDGESATLTTGHHDSEQAEQVICLGPDEWRKLIETKATYDFRLLEEHQAMGPIAGIQRDENGVWIMLASGARVAPRNARLAEIARRLMDRTHGRVT